MKILDFKLSEGLKNLGFNLESRSYYEKKTDYGLNSVKIRYELSRDDTLHGARNYNNPHCMGKVWKMDYITAPTLDEAITWLRNYPKLFIFIDKDSNFIYKPFFFKIQYTTERGRFYGDGNFVYEKSKDTYETYEDAQIAAIQTAINILKHESTKA